MGSGGFKTSYKTKLLYEYLVKQKIDRKYIFNL